MASSLPTSPVRSPSPDRFDQSPNSRLKSLLAAVESDSDDGEARFATKLPSFARRASPATSNRSNDASKNASSDDDVQSRPHITSRIHDGNDDVRARVRDLLQKSSTKQSTRNPADAEMADTAAGSDSEDDIFRPRGRLAARMQGGDKPFGAGMRPGPRKAAREALDADRSSKGHEDVEMADGGADDDEEDDLLLRSRRLKQRQRRSKTPEVNIATPQKETSPGLFVTPSKPISSAQPSIQSEGSGSDGDTPALKTNRIQALIEKHKNKRLAREAEEARKKEARAAAAEALGDDDGDDISDISDDEGGRKLTQAQKEQARPSRKASKKALEEMNRETQRIQRAMQLAHEAKTKKKITKATLFERFNFNPSGSAAKEKLQSSSSPETPVSVKSTDADMQDPETPPSSPPARVEDVLGKDSAGMQSQAGACGPLTRTLGVEGQAEQGNDDFFDILDIQTFARKPVEKGNAKAAAEGLEKSLPPKRQVRVKLPPIQASRVDLGPENNDDDDDDLVILDERRSKLDALFDRAPKKTDKESRSLFALRQLAHLDSPERKAHKKLSKTSMTPGELQSYLNQRAREQARLEKERRIEVLKAKGIHVQTEEERERDREQIEDIVARARREAEEIMDREREDAKKEKRASGKVDPLAWDESGSDDDYVEEVEEQDAAEVELSGSEEEEEDEEMAADEDANDEGTDGLVDQEPLQEASAAQAFVTEDAQDDSASEISASEQSFIDPDEEEERHRWGASDEEEDRAPSFAQARRPKRPTAVISDDEDMDVGATPKPKAYDVTFTPAPKPKGLAFSPATSKASPEVPTSVLRSANKSFIPGLPVNNGGPAGLGLTQIFAGTMDSQAGPFEGSPSQPMPTFDNFPDSQSSLKATDFADGMVLNSQTTPASQLNETQTGDKESQIQFNFAQSQTHGLGSLLRDDIMTQTSQVLEPTQDDGFRGWTPLKERFVEPPSATAETVVHDLGQLEGVAHESPLLNKRGRLRRKAVVASDSEEEGDVGKPTTQTGVKSNVFDVLQDAAAKEKRRKAREEFIKKKSKAKEMVEEQAEESEDEYAGLGGVDGEDSDDDDAASVHEMIDDNTQANKGDDVKLAAYHADRARAEDEKQVDKLFKDITTGMLRRKRGAGDFDLSDSDDGGEARRRMKRRQFAKMQKALFTDERISKVAENPRNQAFMRTIEDIGSDEEMDFLFEAAPQDNRDSQDSSQDKRTQSGASVVPDSQPVAAGSMSAPPVKKRAPAADRRTKTGKKPSDIGEIRETLSNLLDEPGKSSIISATDFGSDSENEGGENDGECSNKENTNPRRSRGHAGQVVDRISLRRQGSSKVSNTSNGGRMAFAAPSSSNGGFKVPALLRRATTNSLVGSSGSSESGKGAANGGSAGGFGEEAKIKSKAGKKSGISYLARENDRRKAVDEAEKRREQRKLRAVQGRSKVIGGLFGAGKFE